MKMSKKVNIISIAFIVIVTIMLQSYNKYLSSTSTANANQPIKVSVLFNNYNIDFLVLLTEDMKKVEQENAGTVQYTFYDGKGNQDIQDNQLKDILAEKNADLIILDMVDLNNTKFLIDRIKENNIPVIFAYNGEINAINSYTKACLVSTNPADGGILEGNIIVDAWNKNKGSIDKNQDDILQYIMLLGPPNNRFATERTKYSILAINNSNVKSESIGTKICNWSEDQAKDAVSQFFLRFGNKIEAIIANSDDMAIGAIKALQEYGYNLGDNTKKIIVVGCDGIPAAQDLIKKGVMTGTVVESTYDAAKNFYTIGMNLLKNKNLIEDTNCTIDNTGKLVTMPYEGVFVNLD